MQPQQKPWQPVLRQSMFQIVHRAPKYLQPLVHVLRGERGSERVPEVTRLFIPALTVAGATRSRHAEHADRNL